MAKKHKQTVSPETQEEAYAMAKKVQKTGQTKEQTKLIAQGIQKGIAEYKKQAKAKQRDADKAKKKHPPADHAQLQTTIDKTKSTTSFLPWALLALSWIGFVSDYFLNR